MSAAPGLDLENLRRGCARCSLHELCLPASIGDDDLHRLDDIVRATYSDDSGASRARARSSR